MNTPPPSGSRHAVCLWANETGVLIEGPAASGKTELALNMILSGRAVLVADDQVIIERENRTLTARPPDNLKGLMQISGIGIAPFDHIAPVPLHLMIELVSPEAVPLMPEKTEKEIEGLRLPVLKLACHDSAASDKIFLATRLLQNGNLFK